MSSSMVSATTLLSNGTDETLTHSKEAYLRTRSESKFDRYDFDSLSNKLLSKLVIRSN